MATTTDPANTEGLIRRAKERGKLTAVDPSRPVPCGTSLVRWRPYEFSLRWGIGNDPLLVNQTASAIHGPIGWVPDTCIHLETPSTGASWFLWTSLQSVGKRETRLAVGTRGGYRAQLRGLPVLSQRDARPEIRGGAWNFREYPVAIRTMPAGLNAGDNPFLLRLTGAGRGSMLRAVVAEGRDLQDRAEPRPEEMPSGDEAYVSSSLVAAEWYTRPREATFDLYGGHGPRALWYRFKTPPGCEAMTLVAHGRPRVWV